MRYTQDKTLADASIAAGEVERNLLPVLESTFGRDAHSLDIDVLVSPVSYRYKVSCLVAHQWRASLPPGSLVQIGEDLFAASPEFCFLQMAAQLSKIELVQLGYSMCGTYHPAEIPRGFVNRYPLTSVERLRDFLEGVEPNTPGVAKARAALAHIIDGSNSPLETCSAMELVLPGTLGGLQLPHPILNARIELGPESRRLSGLSSCVVDALWPGASFSLEVLGSDYHQMVQRDTKRLLGLEHEGLSVCELTYEQVKSVDSMAEIARQLRDRLNKQPSYRTPSESAQRKRAELARTLFPPAARTASGRIVYPKPDWALPADFDVCVAEERRHAALRRGSSR
ncbi:MAG: hypothetical protein ACI360_09040 [Atopobiaceae bacterium]